MIIASVFFRKSTAFPLLLPEFFLIKIVMTPTIKGSFATVSCMGDKPLSL